MVNQHEPFAWIKEEFPLIKCEAPAKNCGYGENILLEFTKNIISQLVIQPANTTKMKYHLLTDQTFYKCLLLGMSRLRIGSSRYSIPDKLI